jgi:MFS transporter, SP family, general alpha glucoside:H+ symporter
VPESPWWLVRPNRLKEATATIVRLTSSQNVIFDVEKNVALMLITTEHECEMNADTSSRRHIPGEQSS